MKWMITQGVKLSGSQRLADQLAINRMIVVTAYDELQAKCWIDQKPKKGSFIGDELPVLISK
jgi:GntR family transcriptional regulator / MocR family aminotransferase